MAETWDDYGRARARHRPLCAFRLWSGQKGHGQRPEAIGAGLMARVVVGRRKIAVYATLGVADTGCARGPAHRRIARSGVDAAGRDRTPWQVKVGSSGHDTFTGRL